MSCYLKVFKHCLFTLIMVLCSLGSEINRVAVYRFGFNCLMWCFEAMPLVSRTCMFFLEEVKGDQLLIGHVR